MNGVVAKAYSWCRSLAVVLACSAVFSAAQAAAITCDSCGPYNGPCQGVETYVNLDGSGSTGHPPLNFSWTSDCPNADLLDPTSSMPILILYNPGLGIAANCNVYLQVGECCENGQCSCYAQCQSEVHIDACQVDCEGTINGTKVLDRCGVCGGDGNSCLGCNSVDITQKQFALDGNSASIRDLVRTTARDIEKLRGAKAADKAFAKKAKKDADKFYNSGWVLAWSLPNIVTTCENQAFCTSTDNSGTIQSFNAASTNLNSLLKSTISRLQKVRHKKLSRDAQRLAKGDSLNQQNLTLSSTVPTVASACTAP